MKFKTWEKIYWVIFGLLFPIYLIPLLGEAPIKVPVQGKEWEPTKFGYFIYILLTYIIFFIPVWIIVRLIVNKGWNEKETK
jgi:hypothetical protein